MENCRLSIIVPVYNSEKYLETCVESVLSQTMSDWELILIDDGSTDLSGTICDAYAETDSRIQVIHKSNAGVSAARNDGIAAATGEFIGFVDADDTIMPNMAERMVATALENNADIAMCDPYVIMQNGSKEQDVIPQFPESRLLHKQDFTPELLRYFAGTVWRCIYRRVLINENNIRFKLGLKLSEDRIFNLCAMGAASAIYYCREPLYNYYILDTGACQKYYSDFWQIVLDTDIYTEEALLKYWDVSYVPVYKHVVVRGALSAIYQICSPRNTDKTIREKLNSISLIAENKTLCRAFTYSSPNGLRERLLYRRATSALFVVGFLYQIKHSM